jgi:hypothetical protein
MCMTFGTMMPTTRKYYRSFTRSPTPFAFKKALFPRYQIGVGCGRGRDQGGENRSSLSDRRDDHFAVGYFVVRAPASVSGAAFGRSPPGFDRPPTAMSPTGVSTYPDAGAVPMAAAAGSTGTDPNGTDSASTDPVIVRDRKSLSAPTVHRRLLP